MVLHCVGSQKKINSIPYSIIIIFIRKKNKNISFQKIMFQNYNAMNRKLIIVVFVIFNKIILIIFFLLLHNINIIKIYIFITLTIINYYY